MAGGAGNIGSAGGMGNASAQPQGGPFGGGMAQPYNSGAPQQSTNQSTPGMQMPQPGSQTPSWAGGYLGQQPMQNPFGQMGALSSPGYGAAEFQQQQRGVLGQGGQQMGQQQGPIRQDMSSMGQPGAPNQMPEPMGQRPAFLDNPDFQAYQKQEQDLGRQMNEYMQKAPMYQQMQELQSKMRGFQQPQQGQMGQLGQLEQRGQMGQNPYLAQRDQMQRQRDMQDQQDYQQRYQQATQDDMRAGFAVMPNQSGYQGQMGRMSMDMPQQPGSESVADNRMGMPDFGGRGQQPEIGIGDFMRRQLPGPRMGGGFGRRGMGGGYGQQMPQQAMGLQGLYSMLQGRRGGPFGGY